MYRTLIFGMAAALMLAGKVSAQSTLPAGDDMSTGTFTGATQTGRPGLPGLPGLYSQLSSGNQKIAEALFQAQQGGGATASWSIEDIALVKRQGSGWSNVFRRMKEDGLFLEKNLGQIISGRGKIGPGRGLKTAAGRTFRPVRFNVIVTTADGRRVVYGLSQPRQRANLMARARRGRAAGSAERTAAWVDGRAVKSHGVKTLARTSRPTVSLTARRAVVATRQSVRLGRIARGAGRKARKVK